MPPETLPTQAPVTSATQPAPISMSVEMSEMGATTLRPRRPCRISSWVAAKGMAFSSAAPSTTLAPSRT